MQEPLVEGCRDTAVLFIIELQINFFEEYSEIRIANFSTMEKIVLLHT